jgi:hypothetical protein
LVVDVVRIEERTIKFLRVVRHSVYHGVVCDDAVTCETSRIIQPSRRELDDESQRLEELTRLQGSVNVTLLFHESEEGGDYVKDAIWFKLLCARNMNPLVA